MKKISFIIFFVFQCVLISCKDEKNTPLDPEKNREISNKTIESELPLEGKNNEKHAHFNKQQYAVNDTLNILYKHVSKTIKNHFIISWAKGDINNDKIDDFIVVLQDKELEDRFDLSGNRIVVFLETLGSFPYFKTASTNNRIIECSNCGGAGVGDPFQKIIIKNGEIKFNLLYGACCKDSESIIFSYNENLKNWFLKKKERISYCCNKLDGDEIATTITTETTQDFGLIEFNKYEYKY